MTITPNHWTWECTRDAARPLMGLLACSFALWAPEVSAQQPEMLGKQTQHQHETQQSQTPQARSLEFPRLGRAQSGPKASLFTLEFALEAARQNNPTYRQAEAGIRAAHARAQQASLYPNPTV